ncbi:MAG: ornithine/acetylornithine aminotransferase, partial [Gammaproteobacteria bacterium]|nr:ornithine/acetylornithine aminotransferase [Gammaproteobacteria bacterium]
IGVIHGGKHSLRFTPPFNITSAEIELVVDRLADALRHGPRRIA